MKIYALDPRKNRKILCGEVVGQTFIRSVKPEHYMEKVKGYGIQEVVFEKMMVAGVTKIRLYVTATGRVLMSTMEDWLNHGKVSDFGNGKQRFLSVKYMKAPIS